MDTSNPTSGTVHAKSSAGSNDHHDVRTSPELGNIPVEATASKMEAAASKAEVAANKADAAARQAADAAQRAQAAADKAEAGFHKGMRQ